MQKAGLSSRRNTRRTVTTTTESNKISNTNTGYRLTKNKRLLDASSYGRVFKKAERSRDKMFTVLSRSNGEATRPGEARLGLAVSKKHCKLAVSRNRIKRLVRESFRHHQAQLSGLDVVVLNQPGTHRASNAELLRSLERHWQQCSKNAQREMG